MRQPASPVRDSRAEAESRRAIRHFAANFDTIIRATGVGMWDWNLLTGEIVHSGQLEFLAGYELGEMPGRDVNARDLLIYPPDRKRADDIIEACRLGKIDSYETEFRIVCKDGAIKWVQDRGAAAERDENGHATRIVGMFYDFNRFKQSEESLIEKVRLLDFAAGMTGMGTIDWNLWTGAVRFDEEFRLMLGYTHGKAANTYERLLRYLHPDDLPGLEREIAAYIARAGIGDSFSRQLRARHARGHYLWFTVTVRIAEWDGDGRAVRAIASCLNVDKLVRAERDARSALMENERQNERLQADIDNAVRDLEEARRTSEAMFDANPYMNLILDDTFTPIDCNPAVVEFFRYPDKASLLRDIMTLIARAIPAYQPSGKRSYSFAQRIADTMKKGHIEFETMMVFDGRETTMNVIMKKISYKDSFAIVVYQVDMTAVKQTENELIYQDRLLQQANRVASLLMETGGNGFAGTLTRALEILGRTLDADRAYIWKNHLRGGALVAIEVCEWVDENGAGRQDYGERVIDYDELLPDWRDMLDKLEGLNTPVDALGERFGGFRGFDGVQSLLIIPILIQGQFWGFVGFDDCRNENRYFSASEEKIMRSAGMLIAAAVLRNEMTESLIAAKETALEGSRAKSDFLSRMSHEIRTPMNAIIGMTAIARKTDDARRMQYCLEKIDGASRQLLNLINDILDMSKIEANKLEITPNEFDFEKMMQNVYNVVNTKLEEKNLELSFDFGTLFTRRIICDELRLSQVLINLLGNAVKFTPEDGRITVRVRHEDRDAGARLHIEVQDTGIGISEEQQARLFSAFEQADGSTTRKYGGTGLGLAICQNIVRLMGGDIRVKSAPGRGSSFIFDVAFEWGRELKEETALRRTEAMRVLVVDDSEDVLSYFRHILTGFSLRCDVAADGRTALQMTERARDAGDPYTVAFVDWQMPWMSGGDTVTGIQRIMGEETVVVMISAADRAQVDPDIALLGIRHFLPKPVLPSTLYNTVVNLTDRTLVTEKSDENEPARDWQGKSILLVEDIEINREILINILDETGVSIDCACDGVEAVDMFVRNGQEYDLILMDVQMPRLDGLGATRRIRACQSQSSGSVPIIAMTANAFKEDVDRCLEAGMNGHVAKPIDMDDLFGTLARYLGA